MINISKFMKSEPYKLGGVKTVTISQKTKKFLWFEWASRECKIHYNQPSDTMIKEYHFAQIENKGIKALNNPKGIEGGDLYKIAVDNLWLPFAKRVIVGFEGYVDENGNKTEEFNEIRKHKENHLVFFVLEVFKDDPETCKKKD